MIRGGRGKKSRKVIDYFVKWKGWTCEHNLWVTENEMGNAQKRLKNMNEGRATSDK